MKFDQALHALRNGKRVCRRGWNGPGMWIMLAEPAAYSFAEMPMDRSTHYAMGPVILLKTASNDLVPWTASQTDLLASDWEEAT